MGISQAQRGCLLIGAVCLLSCGSPLVGGECRPGLEVCEGLCIDFDSDFRNCGRCGNDCGPFVCSRGMCTERVRPPEIMDGSVMLPDGRVRPVDDGGVIVEPPMDSSMPDARPPVPPGYDASFDVDTGLPGCSVGLTECEGECVSTLSDLNHCGECGNGCPEEQVCSGGMCADACVDGLVRCGGTCFDLQADASNCGSCGNVCASGICRSGGCADSVPGQLVVIGHDYTRSNRFQNTLLGNSLFLARGAPVRTLVFAGTASQASQTGVEEAIDFVADSIGREWEQVEGLESLITLQLASADALLIHDQRGSTDSVLTKLGEQWGMAMAEFLVQGGVIVLIEGAGSQNDGTHQILTPVGLFEAGRRERITRQDLEIVSPGIGIALRVGAQYRGENDTVRFIDIATPGTVATRDQDDNPVIFQRIVR
ncbi:MAG: hypothetical protein OXU20_41095 [Myxococcales bacterium]|nr:hypothetical protein [Myxococcales bacterium]MDD9970658.1 hypothetical protein [Myxococcales bacterium]